MGDVERQLPGIENGGGRHVCVVPRGRGWAWVVFRLGFRHCAIGELNHATLSNRRDVYDLWCDVSKLLLVNLHRTMFMRKTQGHRKGVFSDGARGDV